MTVEARPVRIERYHRIITKQIIHQFRKFQQDFVRLLRNTWMRALQQNVDRCTRIPIEQVSNEPVFARGTSRDE